MEQNIPNPPEQNQNVAEPANNPGMPIIDAKKTIMKKYLKVLMIVSAVIVISEILLVRYVVVYSPGLLQLIIYPIIALTVFYAFIKKRAEDLFFQQFSSANNFSFQKTGLPPNLKGSLFSIGHSPSGRDWVAGKIQDISFDLFNYRYIVGSGKNSCVYNYTILRLGCNFPLPPIFLQVKSRWFGGAFLGSPSSENKEKVQLEGNFNDFFNVWTKKDFEIEVFQILTPDVMEKIQTQWKDFSLEFINGQIYIYSKHVIAKDKELENMYQFAQYLAEKIKPVAENMKGDLAAMEKYSGRTI